MLSVKEIKDAESQEPYRCIGKYSMRHAVFRSIISMATVWIIEKAICDMPIRRRMHSIGENQYKGVYRRHNSPTWKARIKYNDRHVELGSFSSEELAAAAYNFAAKVMFGEYHRENMQEEIPDLTYKQKTDIFGKCRRKAEIEGWHVDTKTYRSFYFAEGGEGSE